MNKKILKIMNVILPLIGMITITLSILLWTDAKKEILTFFPFDMEELKYLPLATIIAMVLNAPCNTKEAK